MNLRLRYKASLSKKIIRLFVCFSFLTFLLFCTNTSSRYTGQVEDITKAEVAKWNIKVNNQVISSTGTVDCAITLVTDRPDGKIEPGSTGTFDIEIDPNETEVSVEYLLNFDNLPVGINAVSYEILEENSKEILVLGDIEGNISLDAARNALTSGEKVTLRVHWMMEDTAIDVNTLTDENKQYTIMVGVTAKQKIDNLGPILANLKIGDFVNYNPTPATYTMQAKYTGYSSDQTFETEDLGWRIFGIDYQTGNLELISAKETNNVANFVGGQGFNNGVYLLNEMCSNLYKNNNYHATSRSINLQDMTNRARTDTYWTNYTDFGREYTIDGIKSSSAIDKYKNKTIGYQYITYPKQWYYDYKDFTDMDTLKEKESMNRDLIEYEDTLGYDLESKQLTVRNSFWTATSAELKKVDGGFFETVSNSTRLHNWENVYFELIFHPKDAQPQFWFATRYAEVWNNGTALATRFGFHTVNGGNNQRGYFMYSAPWYWSEGVSANQCKVRPIINLNAKFLNINVDGKNGSTLEKAWELK